ncbi:MAG: DUF4926 domain-containing protein [Desulfohalobiaceae bacterium]|nr:DUF4926 domain-containing protein [Desulfohalobiaceae bacterium]
MKLPNADMAIIDPEKMKIKLLDVVALTGDIEKRGLVKGQVGTIVEILDDGVYEVEFCDNDGRTYATLALRDDQLMVLYYSPVAA